MLLFVFRDKLINQQMFHVYIQLLSSPLFWIITFLSIWVAIMPDIIIIIIVNLKRAQQDPTYKYTSNVSKKKNAVLQVKILLKNMFLVIHFFVYHYKVFLFITQICCIQAKKKWSRSVRTEFNKRSGRVSMMRSTKYKSPLQPLPMNNIQASQTTDIASRVSLTAESQEARGAT